MEDRTLAFDTPAAAKLVDVSESTLKRHRRNGTGPDYVRVGRQIKYRLADLEAWMDRNTIKQG